MKATGAIVGMFLILSGCSSCQQSEPSAGGGSTSANPAAAPVRTAVATVGKIQVEPLQPTTQKREPEAAAPQAQENAPEVPAAGATAAPEADEGDCIVIADANPDYGPPPLKVDFSAEAECGSGQPTYSWNFGEGSTTSTDANPSHTYEHAGEYTATVTVTGPSGSTASDEIDITVEEAEGGEAE